jgi:UDP-3-O-[3-hydroxymyristoyl] glucosamine N-acyltransferase
MQFTAAQIAILLNGKVEGSAEATVSSFGKIEEAEEGQLTFLANPKYEDFLYTTNASIAIINEGYELREPIRPTLIRVANAYSAFALLLSKYQEMATQQLKGIQQPCYISPSAKVADDVYVGAFAYIGDGVKIGEGSKIFPQAFIGDNVVIGKSCIIHPSVKILHDCVLGNHITIHAGTVIGSDGFGFAPQADGSFKKVPQIGNVVIEDHVEIGANTTIDRATMGSTCIKSGAKLDNLIQIAHNVEVGNSTVIAAQAGVSGSTKIGNNVMIGGQAGLVGAYPNRRWLQDQCTKWCQQIAERTVHCRYRITRCRLHKRLRSQAVFRNLPQLEKRIQELETIIKQLMRKGFPEPAIFSF